MTQSDSHKLTRRSFVAASAAAAATLALTSCQPETQVAKTDEIDPTKKFTIDPEFDPEAGAVWMPVVCNANCGGFCENKVLVKDGVVLRQKTDDTTEDTWAAPQLRACPRGRSKQQDTFGVDRLKYPIKRKNWSPEEPNGELRGVDEWERISWDEAFQIVAEQVKNSLETYGDRSILYAGISTSFGQIANCINAFGGAISTGSSESFGSCQYYSDPVIGTPLNGIGESNDRMDFINADYIVLYGCNQAWASPGTYTYAFNEAKQAGTQFVYVGPEFNPTAAHFHAKWIRVRPGTDTALLLAVAYEMFKLDEAEGRGSVIDWDFLAKYTVGIDGDAMPEDAKVQENFRDYLMGAYDGQAKDAEWASPITGTPAEDIRWYADMMRKTNNVMHLRSNAAFRCNDSDNLLQLYMTISLMGGHIGKPGNCADCAYHGTVGSPKNDPIFLAGDWGRAGVAYPNPQTSVVNDNELWPMVLGEEFNNTGNIVFGMLLPESRETADIHVVVMDTVACMNTKLNATKSVEAMRKVDFVVTTARQFTVQAQYADIVLPTVSEWETNGMRNEATWYANREALVIGRKISEPMFEAKTDQQIGYGLAQAMGLDADAMYPVSEEQQWYNLLSTTTMRDEKTGEWGNMFSFTAADIEALGATGEPQDGFMPVSEILEKGVYKVERKPLDGYTYYGYQNFINDPESNPLATVSGKFEIYSQTKADMLNAAGRTKDYTWKPYPSYKVPVNGYEASFVNGDINGEKGDYPIQMFTPHYLRRSHTQYDNLPWLRHAFQNPVFIAATDAAERGVKDGDWVRVFNEQGSILRPASISQRLMPGVMAVPHGAWLDIDPETGYDRAGCENVLTAPVGSGCGTAGYNTNLVNFEKYSGELPDDYQLDPRMPVIAGE